jgi:uncharacterized protein (TIGR02217 family)
MGFFFFFSGSGGAPPASLLFPYSLPGIQFDYLRYYEWSTGVQQALSGKTSTIAYRAFPLVHFEYSFEFLRDGNAEVQAVVGLINAVQGRADTFLHTDPDFNTVTAQPFGTGDGVTRDFQLVATYGNPGGPSAPELVQNLNGSPSIYNNSSLVSTSNYGIDGQGIVHFGTAPTAGRPLTWTGSFYYRCRFDDDHFETKKFMHGLWDLKVIRFTSVTL